VIVTLILLVLQSAGAQSCSCDEDWSPVEQQVRTAFQGSDYIALVEIASTTKIVVTREESWSVLNPQTGQSDEVVRNVDKPLLVAPFNPIRIWKGDKTATTLETSADWQACGFRFKAGSQYLVYAYGPDDNGRIETSRCMRTAPLADSSRDIALLNALLAPANVRQSPSDKQFLDALELIHAFTGAGDELRRARISADALAQSHPASGYSQTLLAEALSTWDLGQDGEPVELRKKIIELADEALRLNPRLAQARVAKARAYTRASLLLEAETEIEKALAMDPRLESAIFQQAEIYRRSGDIAKAETWYQNFIAATAVPARKSNGYYWLGKMLEDIAYVVDGQQRDMYLMRARLAYQSMVDLDPKGAWKLANFAIFLNGYVADYDAAETYAEKALSVMEWPVARYHLAAARYQELLSRASTMDAASLQAAVAQVAASSRVSLEEAMSFRGFSPVIVSRLTDLYGRSAK
jgi:tetratricopeptide (TPR) repeat protein